MAGLLGVLNYQSYIPNDSQASYLADSGSVALTTGTWVLTANFAAVLSNQPTINFVCCFLYIFGVSASTIIGTTDATMDDGTTTMTVGSWPAAVAAVATRGLSLTFTAFNAGKDGGLAVTTGIANIITRTANSAGAQTATGRLIAVGYP